MVARTSRGAHFLGRASKPPLYHWLAAGAAIVLGPSDHVVRLPSVLGALVLVAATDVIGCEAGGVQAAWLAVGMLLATVQFWRSALEARVDMLFAAGIATALAARTRDAARSPHRAFARAIASVAPGNTGIGATWRVSENDVLVLSWLLDPPLPRTRWERRATRGMLAPTGATPVGAAHCRRVVDDVRTGLALLDCGAAVPGPAGAPAVPTRGPATAP